MSAISFGLAFAGEMKYMNPDDANAVKASEAAVSSLGPNRGAVLIESTRRDIVFKSLELVGVSRKTGGSGLALKTDIRNAEKTLMDLGAEKRDMGYDLSMSGDVLFEFDKWDIKPEAEMVLSRLAGALKQLGEKQVTIEGHTDAVGSDAYNHELSEKRAASVKNWLMQTGGVTTAKFLVKGLGESKPVAPNVRPDGSDDPEGQAKNRRVEIYIR